MSDSEKTNQEKDLEKAEKFSKLVIQWLQEGRLWFSKRANVYGEPPVDELDVVIEFPAGSESIGNNGSGSFSWNDIMKMAEEQGLLK